MDLDAVGEPRRQDGLQRLADRGMVVAEAREALPSVEVQVGASVSVVQVGARRRDVLLVEAEDAEDVDERRVEVTGGELQRLALASARIGQHAERVGGDRGLGGVGAH